MAGYYEPPPSAAYPLPPPPGDHYGYGREYDRPYRHEYDERGRGRSRSPPADDYRRARRSMSPPYARGDRYDARPRYDDYDRGRYSPRAPPAYDYRGNKPVDPFTGDYPVSFKHFCDWLRYTNPDIEVQIKEELDREPGDPASTVDRSRGFWSKRYEEYKRDHLQVVTRRIFNYHKGSTWFIERYDPSPPYESQRARVRFEGWSGRQEAFVKELEDGKHDVEITLEEPEPEASKELESPSKENGVKKEAETDVNMDEESPDKANDEFGSRTAEDAQKEEKEDVPMADVKSEQPTTAENGIDRRSKDVRSRIPPELQVSVKPEGNQLLIRTIPPAMSREKIEEVCRGVDGFVYLALGDPQPKKSFYRPGWVKYQDHTDMQQAIRHFGDQRIEGFTMHVVHNTQPYASRLRIAPPISNKPERMRKDLQNVKALARVLEAEWERVRAKVRSDQQEVPQKAAQEPDSADVDAKEEDEVKSEPVKLEESQFVAKFQLNDEKPDSIEKLESRIKVLKQQLREAAQQRAEDKGENEVDQELLATAELRLELDMWLTYLRQAFNTCYYCALICDHAEALQRKCVKHIRQPFVKLTPSEEEAEKEGLKKRGAADDRWLEWLDSKVELLLRRSEVDPSIYGGLNYDEEVRRTVLPHVKQEDEGKFRCQLCAKLFKAQVFVEKHVGNKHAEVIKEVEELVPFLNNFALDPVHITPQQHTSAFTAPPRRDSRHDANFHDERAALHRHVDDRGYGQYNGGNPNGGHGGYGPPGWETYYDGRRSPYGRPGEYPGPSNGDYPRPALPDSLPPKPTGDLDMGRAQPRRRRTDELERRSPPPNAKEDPRARAGRKVSYNDMDSVAEGDVELTY